MVYFYHPLKFRFRMGCILSRQTTLTMKYMYYIDSSELSNNARVLIYTCEVNYFHSWTFPQQNVMTFFPLVTLTLFDVSDNLK